MKSWGRGTAIVIIGIVTATIAMPASPAWATDPPFVGWSAVLPPLIYQYEPNSLDGCVAGRTSCVTVTIANMRNRYTALATNCSHQAVFALAYLRTTETYADFSQRTGFLRDPPFVNHEDAAFAQMYFGAYDNWAAGRIDRVPPAWRVALQAADNKQVSGMGDLLLGMSAHVNRDLPFVLAGIGLTAPDGSSRKPDHDQINVMLNHVVQPLVSEEAVRFDPTIALAPTPFGIGYTGLMQTLLVWRELAWRNAELLVAAPDAATRDLVAAQIETSAAATARGLLAGSAYLPPLTTTVSRDDYCATRPRG